MMDYRPDGKPIKVMTPGGVEPYAGGFVGALMEEGSKVLGGTLLAPGITVPRDTIVGPPREHVVRPQTLKEFASSAHGHGVLPRAPAHRLMGGAIDHSCHGPRSA